MEVRYYLLQYSTWKTLFGTTPQHITCRTKLVWTCIRSESDKSLYYRQKKGREVGRTKQEPKDHFWCRIQKRSYDLFHEGTDRDESSKSTNGSLRWRISTPHILCHYV